MLIIPLQQPCGCFASSLHQAGHAKKPPKDADTVKKLFFSLTGRFGG
jgi:hypothetical protein